MYSTDFSYDSKTLVFVLKVQKSSLACLSTKGIIKMFMDGHFYVFRYLTERDTE